MSVLPKCEKSLYFKAFRRFFDKGCSCSIAASDISSMKSVRLNCGLESQKNGGDKLALMRIK